MSLLNHSITAAMAFAVMAVSCSKPDTADVVVQVGNASLTRADVARVVPRGLSVADSTAFADDYVQSWITDRLVTEVAARNLPDTETIDRMTEDYRRQLIMWEYRRLKLAEEGTPTFTTDSLRSYYDAHRADMRLEQPVARGIYIKIPSSSPALKEVKKLYRSTKSADLDKLEKAAMRDAVHYDYFLDTWVSWPQIEAKIPYDFSRKRPQKGETYELNEGGFTYLLNITDYIPAGVEMPFEVAEPFIRERLTAANALDTDRDLLQTLYRRAMADGTIRFPNANTQQ